MCIENIKKYPIFSNDNIRYMSLIYIGDIIKSNPEFQCSYGRHSTETALLRVVSDINAAAVRHDVSLLF